jgi:hypothetical protein
MRKRLIASLVVSGLLISTPLAAHHGNADLNTDKTITVKGSVTEWVWANPHCFLKFDEETTDGKVRHWIVETNTPAGMVNIGWSKYTLKSGDQVTVAMHPLKDGSKPIGRIVRVTLAGGKVLETGDTPATASSESKTYRKE